MSKRILLTNDDGIAAEGILLLEAALQELGEVTVVAPAENVTGASQSITLTRPIKVDRHSDTRYTVYGTPADCVTLAVSELMKALPDIIVSGINNGANISDDILSSGTVGAALLAIPYGLPGIALSLERSSGIDYTYAVQFGRDAVATILAQGLPPRTILNVNIPQGIPKGWKYTRLAERTMKTNIVRMEDGSKTLSYKIGSDTSDWIDAQDGDYQVVSSGYVSVTLLGNDLTSDLERTAQLPRNLFPRHVTQM